MLLRNVVIPLAVTGLVCGCAPALTQGQSPQGSVAPAQSSEQRGLRIALRSEPYNLTDFASTRNAITLALFGAKLAYTNDADIPYAVLAEAVPQLDSDTWRVLPDGRMETTYHLRPNLTWHDGTPLTGDDFVFTYQADDTGIQWGIRENAVSPVEHRAIDQVTAPDPRTVVIRWKQLYRDAAAPDLKVLPRHILEPAIAQGQSDVLGGHPYWTTEYVGVGPYRVANWQSGAFLEGTAFDGFALGRPKIDKVLVTWNGDPQATLARMLSGDVDMAVDGAIFYVQAATVKQEMVPRGNAVVLLQAGTLRFLAAQHRPAYATPAALLDVRVRQATAHSLDRQALSDALTDGYGPPAALVAPPGVRYHAELQRVGPTYDFDLRQTEQLMAEAGFSRGADGIYASPTEGRLSPEVMGVAEGQEGQETTIIADYLKRAGIDTQLRLVPQNLLAQSDEMKATYPAWRTNYGLGAPKNLSADRLLGSRAATPENHWSGTNKMGWDNAEHDRLYDQWLQALDPNQADRILVQIGKVQMGQLPVVPTYFDPTVAAQSADLVGPSLGFGTAWHNIHTWYWK